MSIDLIKRLRLGTGTSPDHELLLEAAKAIEEYRMKYILAAEGKDRAQRRLSELEAQLEELQKQEPDRIHIAGLIDPLTRTQHPDNLTMAVAAKLLRDTAPLPTPIQQEALMRVNLIGTPAEVIPMDRDLLRDFILARPDTEGSGK